MDGDGWTSIWINFIHHVKTFVMDVHGYMMMLTMMSMTKMLANAKICDNIKQHYEKSCLCKPNYHATICPSQLLCDCIMQNFHKNVMHLFLGISFPNLWWCFQFWFSALDLFLCLFCEIHMVLFLWLFCETHGTKC